MDIPGLRSAEGRGAGVPQIPADMKRFRQRPTAHAPGAYAEKARCVTARTKFRRLL